MDAQGRMLPFAATRQRVGHYSDWCVLHRAPIGMPHLDLWITRGRLWLTPSSTARGNIQVVGDGPCTYFYHGPCGFTNFHFGLANVRMSLV